MIEGRVDKKILIVATEYFSFVKDQTESIAHFFPEVAVLVRYNPLAEISSILPISSLTNFRRANLIKCDHLPPTITVIPTPVWYIPTDYFYKRLGENHFSAASDSIKRNRLRFDLIHAHATWSAGYVGARLKEHYDVPLVVTAHGYDIYSLPFKDSTWKEKIEYVLNSADVIITVSQKNLECIKMLNVHCPVQIIPNGFRSDLFYPRDMMECRKELGLPPNRKIILAVGNLEPVKGHTYLLEAIGSITEQRKDIFCVIVGTGSQRRALEKQIRTLGLSEFVMLAGNKPHADIPTWINACDIFVLPSLNEGNPTVMFEALGCGKPFVGTRVGGVPGIIVSDMYGLLAEQGNSGDLEEKILLALDREWNPKSILEYAFSFTWESISMEILKVYRGALGEVP
jgi:glycosyltransferase involved in cell wall biosynthesis